MRTTLDIDEDVLEAAKDLAASHGTTMGKVLSDLARRALAPARKRPAMRNGVPILEPRTGEKIVTSEVVNRLRDEP